MSVLLEAIRASAGSGKTYALTTRYLRILQRGEAPDRILATTFTRKAAGEILGRVLKRMAEAADDPAQATDLLHTASVAEGAPAELRFRLAELCRSLHRVSISTLDSFFSRLSTSFRHELGLPAGATLMEGESPAALILRLEAVRAVLAEGPLEELVRLLDQLHGGRAQSSVTLSLDTLISQMYEVYLQSQAEAWHALRVPEDPGEEAVERVLGVLAERARAVEDNRLRKAIEGDLPRAQAGDWLSFLSKGLAPKVMDDMTYYRKPIPADIGMLYEVLIDRARFELIGGVAEQTHATYDLLRRFDGHYQQLRRRKRALLFSDVPRALSSFLADRPLDEVAYRLDGRVDHLLLDEFQDTSPEQWSILRPFAQRIAGGGAGQGSLFCVGDVKQAIYGWRGGCAEIFNELDKDLADLSWDSTDRSYRSSAVVLDAINQLFSTLATNPALGEHASEAQYWQAGFKRHEAVRRLPGYVELSTTPAPAESATSEGAGEEGESPGHEASVAARIGELAAQCPGALIGVLMRTNDAVRRMIYLLQKRGLQASGEGGSPVDDDPAVETVLAALTLADHPGDTAAAFQILNSPLAAVLGLENESPEPIEAVSRGLRSRLLTEGYAGVVAAWSRRLAPHCDRRGAQRLTQLVELAELFDREAGLRPEDFVRFVRATPVEEPVPARIRVMSIHRAKGLEFDLVVLPELHKKIAAMSPVLLVDRPAPASPIRAVYRCPVEAVRKLSPELERTYQKQRSAEIQESLCLLYVAMTRARHALHMFVPPLRPKADGAARNEGLTHAAVVRGGLLSGTGDEGFAGGECLFQTGDPQWYTAMTGGPEGAVSVPPGTPAGPVQMAAIEGMPRRGWKEVHPSELENDGRVTVGNLLQLEDTEPQKFGTLIHAWFEQIGWSDDPLPPDEELIEIGRRAVPDEEDAWYTAGLEAFKVMLENPGVRAALARPEAAEAAELWRERPFAALVEGALVSGIFDRVLVFHEGEAAVRAELLDFKTDVVPPHRLHRTLATYRPQLTTYRQALCALLGLPPAQVTVRLLLVKTGNLVEI